MLLYFAYPCSNNSGLGAAGPFDDRRKLIRRRRQNPAGARGGELCVASGTADDWKGAKIARRFNSI